MNVVLTYAFTGCKFYHKKSKPILNLIYDIHDEVLGTKCPTDQKYKDRYLHEWTKV